MSFTAPALLAALLALPLLWWLLRATPPAPQIQDFPAVRLLMGLEPGADTPARTPLLLLLLRLAAAALAIVGLAGPHGGGGSPGAAARGAPRLLLIDNGWAAAHDWQLRLAAADRLLASAEATDQPIALLATARDPDDAPPSATGLLPAEGARAALAAIAPRPWSTDRFGAARALDEARRRLGALPVDWIADGVATGGDAAFDAALVRMGPVDVYADSEPARALEPPVPVTGGFDVTLRSVGMTGRPPSLLALDESGAALARVPFGPAMPSAHGVYSAVASVRLPLELRNELTRLVVEPSQSASSTVLLDESDRSRPIGIVSGDGNDETPLLGSLYYIGRAFGPGTTLRTGTLDSVLDRPLSVLIAADRVFDDHATRARLIAWVRSGGMLVRFAGPRLAAAGNPVPDNNVDETGTGADPAVENAPDPDPLLPVSLLPGSRALGGAMSWNRPQHLAPFPPGSPFNGLAVPRDVTVRRQILARPTPALARDTWAALADGTPIVTTRRLGDGRLVLFHVSANAAWSNLPLSGLFPAMLGRLVRLAAGVAAPGNHAPLAPVVTLDAFGIAETPGAAVTGVPADAFGSIPASPRHPPGFYGEGGERRALNLADVLGPLAAATLPAPPRPLVAGRADRPLGPLLLAVALALLAVDGVISLGLRGHLGSAGRSRRRRRFGGGARIAGAAALLLGGGLLVWAPPARAAGETPPAPIPEAALQNELAFVVTGNADVDRLSRDGLAALSDTVNARTAATLGPPAGVVPGRDDLAFYPLLYWPVLPDATDDRRRTAALLAYMRTGGIVLIDTEGGDPDAPGSGAGFAPGVGAALKRVTAGLDIPALARLTPTDVLAHTFYLLRDFPGRFEGAPVWVERDTDTTNDGVSPVIIGSNDWAASWAVGPDGQHEAASIPDGEEQRALSLRFGVNLVMYALTGSYKADQVHVPAILQRLGGDNNADEEGE